MKKFLSEAYLRLAIRYSDNRMVIEDAALNKSKRSCLPVFVYETDIGFCCITKMELMRFPETFSNLEPVTIYRLGEIEFRVQEIDLEEFTINVDKYL